jgi:beta-1,4-mannosyl-glycoprotein beta-1,4-N-acetylglucosaminyltransferase
MKIIDTIMFCNEYDMLELRLKIMAEHVDKIVIVECDKTFTGVYKGFNLEKQLDRYAQWMHKIIKPSYR